MVFMFSIYLKSIYKKFFLYFTKANGNIKGIRNIITNNLNKLSLYKRHLDCYDKNKKNYTNFCFVF